MSRMTLFMVRVCIKRMVMIMVRMRRPGHMLSSRKKTTQVNRFNSSLDSLLYRLWGETDEKT